MEKLQNKQEGEFPEKTDECFIERTAENVSFGFKKTSNVSSSRKEVLDRLSSSI